MNSLTIRYRFVEGWHVLQCDELPGLYVAHRDRRRAYQGLGPAIEKLMELDAGVAPIKAEQPMGLVECLRASAKEVESFPHPSYCDHLHVATQVMHEAGDEIERLNAVLDGSAAR